MRLSPVSVILFAVVFAVLLQPLLQALISNMQNALAVVPIPNAKSDVDLGERHAKTLSDWLFSVLTSPIGLVAVVAIGLATYAASEAVKPTKT